MKDQSVCLDNITWHFPDFAIWLFQKNAMLWFFVVKALHKRLMSSFRTRILLHVYQGVP